MSAAHRSTGEVSSRARGLWLAVGSACGIAALALLAWFGGDGGEPEFATEGASAAPAIADTAAGDASSSPSTDATTEADAARSDLSGTAEATASQPTVERTRHHLRVRVIDARTREPVPDAEVVADPFVDGPHSAERQRAERRTMDRLDCNLATGQVTRTDADGVAWVKVKGAHAVSARKDALSATARVNFDTLGPAGLELRLRASPQVTVKVLDANGAPARDVPVALFVGWDRDATNDGSEIWQIGWTGEDGIAKSRLDESLRGRSMPVRMQAYVSAPGLVQVRAPVLPTFETVRLQLPPTGSVRVRATGPAGAPLADRPVWFATVSSLEVDRGDRRYGEGSYTDAGLGGEVVFAHVGLGLDLSLSMYVGTYGDEAKLRGPMRAGEVVEHSFDTQKKPGYVASGRLLDENGAPLVDVRAFFRETSGGVEEVRTDAEGRFFVRARVRRETPVAQMQAWALLADGLPCQFEPFELTLGTPRDLGDLRAKPCVLVATGEVVTESVVPPGLQLSVRETNAPSHPGYEVVIAEDRTFRIFRRMGTPIGAMTLTAQAAGFANVAPIPFANGAHLRVELRRGVHFRARIVVDPAILDYVQQSALDMVMTREDGDGTLVRGTLADGEFVFESATLGAGMYRIAVESGNASDDLAQMDAVRLAPGEPTDARLQPWDLRNEIQLRTMRLRKSDGSLLPTSGYVQRKRANDGQWESCTSIYNGVGKCITTMVPSDLLLSIEGHGTFLRRQVMGDLDLVVPEPQRFRVVLEGLPRVTTEAPFHAELLAGPEWARAQGMPDGTNPVVGTTWKPVEGLFEVVLVEPVRATLRLVQRLPNDRIVLMQQEVTFEAGKPEVRVQTPPNAIAAMQPFVQAGAPR